MMLKNKFRNDCGFTLLEMLIAILLLSVGFLGTATVLWTSQKAGSFSRNMTTAAVLNQDLMERLNFRNYTGLKNGAYSDNPSDAAFARFTRSYTVQDLAPAGKTITVNITWKEAGAVQKNRTFTTVRRSDF